MSGPEGSAPSEPALDRIRALADPRVRRVRGRFFVEGIRNLVEAHDAGAPIEELVVSTRLLTSPVGQKLVRRQRRRGVPVHRVSPEAFRAISSAERASGVGAIVRAPWERLGRIGRGSELWVAVSEVAKPGNLGTILRTAEAVRASGLIVLGDRVDPFDPAVVRGSMGALFHQRFVRTDLAALGRWASTRSARIVGASPDAEARFDSVDLGGLLVLLLGSERKGLTEAERGACHALARLPMRGRVDSLNVGVAAGVLLYEAYRARGFEEAPGTPQSPGVTPR